MTTTTIEPDSPAGQDARVTVRMCFRQLSDIDKHLHVFATEGEDVLHAIDVLAAQLAVVRKLTESMIRDAQVSDDT